MFLARAGPAFPPFVFLSRVFAVKKKQQRVRPAKYAKTATPHAKNYKGIFLTTNGSLICRRRKAAGRYCPCYMSIGLIGQWTEQTVWSQTTALCSQGMIKVESPLTSQLADELSALNLLRLFLSWRRSRDLRLEELPP